MAIALDRREAMAVLAAAALPSQAIAADRRIEIFGHRGASALRPEHTLASYEKALDDGADFIEPDLVISKDGALVIRHEPNIAETTDVARRPEFASRRTEKTIDGQMQAGWFAEDFTLAELRTLRAIERLPQLRPANAAMDGRYGLVTWHEMIDFAEDQARRRGRLVGLVPELKHSTYFRSIGLPLEERFIASLARGYASRCPLVIQSFEVSNLKLLRAKLPRRAGRRLMQLTASAGGPPDLARQGGGLSYADMLRSPGLAAIRRYADIVAPELRSVIPLGSDKRLLAPTAVVADAHRAGLKVMPYTFRPENFFLAADFQNEAGPAARNPAGSIKEIEAYVAAGIDGLFTDDPMLAWDARRSWLGS